MGFPEYHWKNDKQRPSIYMGRLPVYGQAEARELSNPLRPPEQHDDGCPGGWYRSEFIASLQKYERIFLESGFCSNVLLDRTDDRLVIEATQYLELERIRHKNHSSQVMFDGSK